MLKSNQSHHLYGFTDLKTLNERGPVIITHGKGIYVYDIHEKKYLDVILDRYDEQDQELLKLRTQFLDSILEKGIEEVKNFVVNLSKSLKSKIGEDMKDAYLELFKEVIMLDKNIHDNERVLYQLLCEQWGRESGI